MAAALGLGLALALGGIFFALTCDLSEEKAREVLASVGEKRASARSAEEELLLGHAHRVLGDSPAAFRAYRRALAKGAYDERMLAYALASLDGGEAEPAVELLTGWPEDIQGALRARLDGPWWPRHNALRILELREKATGEDIKRVGLLDLATGKTCGQRRFGLLLLKRSSGGEDALSAVRAAAARMPDNLCMALDLPAVEKALSRP